MSLTREFSKSIAPDLRDKTAHELRELRAERSIFNDVVSEQGESLTEKSLFKQLAKSREATEKARIQETFNKRLAEVLEACPLSKDEQETYLSEEYLKKITLDDYLFLMKRLSGLYVSHVTRYGVRENIMPDCHNMGEGEFMDNFTGILRDKRLMSLFSNMIKETDYCRKAIRTFISNVKKDSPEAGKEEVARIIFDYFLENEKTERIGRVPADLSSSHFGINDILGRHYGAENNYDIYFYFPAEVIAKNYHHSDKYGAQLEKSSSDFDNDLYVWNQGKGVAIDAGILCIPKNIKVDRKTGSQYLLNSDNGPTVIEEVRQHVDFYTGHEDEFRSTLTDLKKQEGSFVDKESFYQSAIFTQAAAALNFTNCETFKQYYEFAGHEKDVYHIRDFPPDLKRFYQFGLNTYYQKPSEENLVTSQDFWENYFSQNPELKPSKIFYYDKKFETEGDQAKADQYRELFSQNRFSSSNELPNYPEYLDGVLDKVRLLISNICDEEMRAPQEQIKAA